MSSPEPQKNVAESKRERRTAGVSRTCQSGLRIAVRPVDIPSECQYPPASAQYEHSHTGYPIARLCLNLKRKRAAPKPIAPSSRSRSAFAIPRYLSDFFRMFDLNESRIPAEACL
jgi:hypothetical protein